MDIYRKYFENNPKAIAVTCAITSLVMLSLFAMVFAYIWLGYPPLLLTPIIEYIALTLFYAFLGTKALRDPPEYKANVVAAGAVVSTAIMWLAFIMQVKAVLI